MNRKRKDKISWESETAKTLSSKRGFQGFLDTYQKGKLIGWELDEIFKIDGRPSFSQNPQWLAWRLTGREFCNDNTAWESLYRLRYRMTGRN